MPPVFNPVTTSTPAAVPSGHLEYVVAAEDDLVVKLPASIDLQQAALFGMASVALNTCRNAPI